MKSSLWGQDLNVAVVWSLRNLDDPAGYPPLGECVKHAVVQLEGLGSCPSGFRGNRRWRRLSRGAFPGHYQWGCMERRLNLRRASFGTAMHGGLLVHTKM